MTINGLGPGVMSRDLSEANRRSHVDRDSILGLWQITVWVSIWKWPA